MKVSVRPFQTADIPSAHALSRSVNWPHRLGDWWFMATPGSGFVAEAEGRLAGTALWWPYGADHASLGMVIVPQKMQGQGIGSMLMERVIESTGTRTLRLNSTEEGRRLYERFGFETVGRILQYQGEREKAADQKTRELRRLEKDDLMEIYRIDRTVLGYDREALLRRLSLTGEGLIHESKGEIKGYGFIRPFGRGELVGPVLAASDQVALGICRALVSAATGFVRVDLSAGDSDLAGSLTEHGLAKHGEVVSMVRGPGAGFVSADTGWRQFAPVSQAFG